MVFADGNPAFGSTFGARFSSPEAGATSSVSNAPPDAAKAVDKLAESFREMLMRAVESDPSQVRALTSLVSNLGLEAGDGTSQQEIKKMTESLNKLSVGKDAIDPVHQPGNEGVGASPSQAGAEAAGSPPAFQFRADSPERAANFKQDLGGGSKKSPLRPARNRPASRRTRLRPSAQLDTKAPQMPVFSSVPETQASPIQGITPESKAESRHAELMKQAIRQVDECDLEPQVKPETVRPPGRNNFFMDTATHSESSLPVEAGGGLRPQPPMPFFTGASSQATAAQTRPIDSQRSQQHPVAPFPASFSQTKPRLNTANEPSSDPFSFTATTRPRADPEPQARPETVRPAGRRFQDVSADAATQREDSPPVESGNTVLPQSPIPFFVAGAGARSQPTASSQPVRSSRPVTSAQPFATSQPSAAQSRPIDAQHTEGPPLAPFPSTHPQAKDTSRPTTESSSNPFTFTANVPSRANPLSTAPVSPAPMPAAPAVPTPGGPMPAAPMSAAPMSAAPMSATPMSTTPIPAAFAAGLGAATGPQNTPVVQVTPHINLEGSSNVSPMSTATPFFPQASNPFLKSSESSQSKPMSPAADMQQPTLPLKFTGTPPSADGAPQLSNHRTRPLNRRRRRHGTSASGTDTSMSPAANPPIDAALGVPLARPISPAAFSPSSATKPTQPGQGNHTSFHVYAKENNSPRSNGGHATASNAENDKSLGEVPAPQAALNAACEHRNKGNTLFKQKMYTEAEAAYSAALKALLVHKQSYPADVKARQVAVFYSNRAAAKLMLNRPQDALPDCHAALEADEGYKRAQERAASCYRRMGELKKAEQLLSQAVQASTSAPGASAEDRVVLAERLAELRQLQKDVKDLWAAVATAESPEALAKLNKDTEKLLNQLQDCPRARILRAAAQLRCGAWEGACSSAASAGQWPSPRIKLQAWWINCECLYAQGELEQCAKRLNSGLPMLRQLESAEGVGGLVVQDEDDCIPLPASTRVQELASKMQAVLRCKQQGNAAFQAKEYSDAEKHYTAALAIREVAAPAFIAVLYSNRAAVHMEQKRWVDALADCGRARALNPSFHRVLRRLAKIHEELGRPGQAADCLNELKTLGGVKGVDAVEIHRLLHTLNAKKRMENSPNHFRMLNVATTAAVPELKTAFRKLAVQYHPDKALAGCVVTCSLSGSVTAARDEGLNSRLRESANELFQLVNEAWETLQDSSRRHMCRLEHDEDYLHQEPDTFAFMYEAYAHRHNFSRRRW